MDAGRDTCPLDRVPLWSPTCLFPLKDVNLTMNAAMRCGRYEDVIVKKRSRVWKGNTLVVLADIGIVLLFMGISTTCTIPAGWPPSKAWLQVQQQVEMAEAQAHARPKPTPHAPPLQPAPTRQAGIANMHQGPFPASQFVVRNFWQGPVGSEWYLVYAGARVNPNGSAGQGALVLYTEKPTSDGGFDINSIGTYPAPHGDRALTITAVNGHSMQLRTDTGSTLVFDLQTKQYS